MFKRKIYNKLLSWIKETNGKKVLLIEGARRIGKSTIAEEFGKNEYKSYIVVDFNDVSIIDYTNGNKTKQKIYLIEVKSSKKFTTKSLDNFIQKYGNRIGTAYIISPKNLSFEGNVLCIPSYMAICL